LRGSSTRKTCKRKKAKRQKPEGANKKEEEEQPQVVNFEKKNLGKPWARG